MHCVVDLALNYFCYSGWPVIVTYRVSKLNLDLLWMALHSIFFVLAVFKNVEGKGFSNRLEIS